MPDPSQLGSGDQPQIDKQELAFYEKMKKDLRDLLSKKKAIDKNLAAVEDYIFRYEGAYLEDALNGNIIQGFDNYLKGSGSGAGGHGNASNALKRKGTYTDNDRLFSLSSATYLKSVQKDLFESVEDNAAATPAGPTNGSNPTLQASTKASSSHKKKKRKKGEDHTSSDSEEETPSNSALPKRLRLQLKDEE
ncbi:histone acetyltransferase subunit NuA4-domain-containing protein [Lipomyces chichibuensis]|uniref:histone acetyltransferase subunit NuA4-domain-containing protein n=1 Tax=Lipomyces chichibuensis TaxID=1546026 RepID=UPI003343821D